MGLYRPLNFINDRYLRITAIGEIKELIKQIEILKGFWMPHEVTRSVNVQNHLDYQISYLEYVLFWRTVDIPIK